MKSNAAGLDSDIFPDRAAIQCGRQIPYLITRKAIINVLPSTGQQNNIAETKTEK